VSSPTLLLVPGAWHGPWVWDTLRPQLTDVPTETVALRSVGDDAASRGDLFDDARAVREAADAIEGPVVVCAHSYGGAVASQGLAGLDGVARIVYLAAFMLDAGESLLGAAGGHRPPWWDVREDEGAIVPIDPRGVFYHDVKPGAADAAIARLRPIAYPTVEQPLTAAAWHDIPSSYIVCDDDRAFPPGGQDGLAARAQRVHHLPTSHSPMLSDPAALAALLRAELADA
jgi:pimeloyl-ACP methyl ester carboxylesterase